MSTEPARSAAAPAMDARPTQADLSAKPQGTKAFIPRSSGADLPRWNTKMEGTKLAIYITQARYTHQAISGLVQNPEDRYEEVRGLFERAGCKLLSYYITFGEYDFIITYEAPNPVAVMSVLATAGAGGGVTDTKTITAVSTAEAKQAFEMAKASAGKFRSAGT